MKYVFMQATISVYIKELKILNQKNTLNEKILQTQKKYIKI